MKKLQTLIIVGKIVFCLFLISNVKGQDQNDSNHTKIIVNEAMERVLYYLDCFNTQSPDPSYNKSILVYLHKSDSDTNVFSISSFPFNENAIENLVIIGYFYFNKNIAFVAVENDSQHNFPDLNIDNLDHLIDSALNRYENSDYVVAGGSIFIHYYYYLFKYKDVPWYKNKIKINYKYYRCFGDIPIKDRGLENKSLQRSVNWQYFVYDRKSNIFHYCDNYNKLDTGQKMKLEKGTFKVKVK